MSNTKINSSKTSPNSELIIDELLKRKPKKAIKFGSKKVDTNTKYRLNTMGTNVNNTSRKLKIQNTTLSNKSKKFDKYQPSKNSRSNSSINNSAGKTINHNKPLSVNNSLIKTKKQMLVLPSKVPSKNHFTLSNNRTNNRTNTRTNTRINKPYTNLRTSDKKYSNKVEYKDEVKLRILEKKINEYISIKFKLIKCYQDINYVSKKAEMNNLDERISVKENLQEITKLLKQI